MAAARPKQARVYFHREGSRVIVVTVHYNQDGMQVEAEGPLSLTSWTDQDLGDSIKLALEQSATITRDLRGWKQTDWPALKVSGERSVRAFQSSFIQIDVAGANYANIIYMIEGLPGGDDDLTVRTSVVANAPAAEYARQLVRVFHACRDRKL